MGRRCIILGFLATAFLLPVLGQDVVVSSVTAATSVPAAKSKFGLDLDLSYEYRYAPGGEVIIEKGYTASGIDLQRDYFDRTPFGRLALGYGGQEGLSLAIEATFRSQWAGDYYKADNLPIVGQAGDPFLAENSFLTRGVAYWRSRGIAIAFGRDQVDYGGILYGSLLPSFRLPYLDCLRARSRLGDHFTLDWMVSTMPAIKSWDGVDVSPNEGVDTASVGELYGWESGITPTTIVEVLNRVSWELGSFCIGVNDHAMMSRRNNRFYLTDFFPVISHHQTSILQTNNSLVFDLTWKPRDDFVAAGQLGLDDVSADIFGISDTGAPTIWAYVVGFEYTPSLARVPLTVKVETGYTHYLWGNYDGSQIHPNDVNPLMRFQYRYLSDSGALLLPLTGPYGPGALWFKASSSLDIGPRGLSMGISVLFLAKNEEANLISTPLDTSAAAGATTTYFDFSLPLTYSSGMWNLGMTPSFVILNGGSTLEITFLAAMRLKTGDRKVVEVQPWAAPFH